MQRCCWNSIGPSPQMTNLAEKKAPKIQIIRYIIRTSSHLQGRKIEVAKQERRKPSGSCIKTELRRWTWPRPQKWSVFAENKAPITKIVGFIIRTRNIHNHNHSHSHKTNRKARRRSRQSRRVGRLCRMQRHQHRQQLTHRCRQYHCQSTYRCQLYLSRCPKQYSRCLRRSPCRIMQAMPWFINWHCNIRVHMGFWAQFLPCYLRSSGGPGCCMQCAV